MEAMTEKVSRMKALLLKSKELNQEREAEVTKLADAGAGGARPRRFTIQVMSDDEMIHIASLSPSALPALPDAAPSPAPCSPCMLLCVAMDRRVWHCRRTRGRRRPRPGA